MGAEYTLKIKDSPQSTVNLRANLIKSLKDRPISTKVRN